MAKSSSSCSFAKHNRPKQLRDLIEYEWTIRNPDAVEIDFSAKHCKLKKNEDKFYEKLPQICNNSKISMLSKVVHLPVIFVMETENMHSVEMCY